MATSEWQETDHDEVDHDEVDAASREEGDDPGCGGETLEPPQDGPAETEPNPPTRDDDGPAGEASGPFPDVLLGGTTCPAKAAALVKHFLDGHPEVGRELARLRTTAIRRHVAGVGRR